MKQHIKNFKQFKESKINESFIIGNYPLEDVLSGKNRIEKLLSTIILFEDLIIKKMEEDKHKDYDVIISETASKIKKTSEEFRLLEDQILDVLHSYSDLK